MKKLNFRVNIILTLAILFYVSTSVAEVIEKRKSSEADKFSFSVNKNLATLYFYRKSSFIASNFDVNLLVNDMYLGLAENRTAFVAEVIAGEHDLWLKSAHSNNPWLGHKAITVEKGKVYFISVDLIGDSGGDDIMYEVDEEIGRIEVLKVISIAEGKINNN